MPRRYRKKRGYKKRRARRSNAMVRYTGGGLTRSCPLPKTFKFRSKYLEPQILLNPASGTIASYVFTMNGIQDPNVTGAGHQVLGFDEIMPLYDHFTVIGSRARVTFINQNATTPIQVVLSLRDNSTVTNDDAQIIENGLCRYATLGGSNGGRNQATLQMNCSPTKFFGQKVVGEDKYQGTISNNPADQVYLHIMAYAMDGTTDPASDIIAQVEIDYVTILTEPKLLARS